MKFPNMFKPIDLLVNRFVKQVRLKAPVEKKTTTTKKIPISSTKQIYMLYADEFSNLTIDNLKYYFSCTRNGLPFWVSLLYKDIKRKDLHLGGVIQTRKYSILGKLRHTQLENLVNVNDWDEGKKFIMDNLSRKSVKFQKFLANLIDTPIQGVTIYEKVFEQIDRKTMLKELCMIPGHLIIYDEDKKGYTFLDPEDNDAVKLRSLGQTGQGGIDFSQIKTIDVIPEKLLIVDSYEGDEANGFMNGFYDSLIWYHFFKSFSLKDWSIFLELYGMPARVGKFDSLMINPEELVKFEDAVKNFGSDYYAVMPKDYDIELKDTTKTASSSVYETFIDYWDRKASIRILGQNLTTEVKGGGSYAAVKGADVVREDIDSGDTLLVESAVNELIKDLIDLNFSNPPEYPIFKFPLAKNLKEMETKARTYIYLKSIGYAPTKEVLEKEFEVELDEVEAEEQYGNQMSLVDRFVNGFLQEKMLDDYIGTRIDERNH